MKILLNNLKIFIKSLFNENTVKNLYSRKLLGVFLSNNILVYISKENEKNIKLDITWLQSDFNQ